MAVPLHQKVTAVDRAFNLMIYLGRPGDEDFQVEDGKEYYESIKEEFEGQLTFLRENGWWAVADDIEAQLKERLTGYESKVILDS